MSESARSIASVVSLLITNINGTISTMAIICTPVALIVRITLRLLGSILGRSSKWIRHNEERLAFYSTASILFCCFSAMLYLMINDEVPYPTAQWLSVVLCTGCLVGIATVFCLLAAVYRLYFEWSKPSRIRTSLNPPMRTPAEHDTSDSVSELSSIAELYKTALTKYRAARERHADAMKSYEKARTEMERAWEEVERATRDVTRALCGKKL